MQRRELEEFQSLYFLVPYLIGHNGYIAGGCFKNIFKHEKIKDIDIFFKSENDFVNAKRLFSNSDKYKFNYENNKVYAYKEIETDISIELIRWKFAAPQKMIDEFDFTITKFCLCTEYDNEDEEHQFKNVIYHNDKFFEHLFFNRLVLDDKILFPASTFERVCKYIKYGYAPCKETKIKLLEAIKNINTNIEISKSLYDGID